MKFIVCSFFLLFSFFTNTHAQVKRGGTLSYCHSDYIRNLYPHNITDAISYNVANHVYEGLFRFDASDLSTKKCLAESYSVDSTGTVYTITLKKNVFFHDDACFKGGKGREMTSEDIRYCFTKLCMQDISNQGFQTFQNILKGANEYYEASANGVTPGFRLEGIRIVDRYSFQLILYKPYTLFLTNLARPFAYIFPQEAHERYGLEMRNKAVGTGPFKIKTMQESALIVLSRNEKYHEKDEQGNALPYLNEIRISFFSQFESALENFEAGKLDFISVRSEKAVEYSNNKKYTYQYMPELATHFLFFQNQTAPFTNKNLRKALNFAIDREKLAKDGVKDPICIPVRHGITPAVFAGYNTELIRGYAFNLDSAKFYLKKAGYNRGEDLGILTVDVNNDGEKNVQVAEEIRKQIKKHLNISLELNIIGFAPLVENLIGGNFGISRGGWIADYPSPENFLWFAYGKAVPEDPQGQSYPNMMRYVSADFDRYYEEGLHAMDEKTANAFFMKAEQVMVEDAPLILLWHDARGVVSKKNLKGLYFNSMMYMDPRRVYKE